MAVTMADPANLRRAKSGGGNVSKSQTISTNEKYVRNGKQPCGTFIVKDAPEESGDEIDEISIRASGGSVVSFLRIPEGRKAACPYSGR